MLGLAGGLAGATEGGPEPLTYPQGDVNCSGTVDTSDALAILRWQAGLAVRQPSGCMPIGCAQVYPDLYVCQLPE